MTTKTTNTTKRLARELLGYLHDFVTERITWGPFHDLRYDAWSRVHAAGLASEVRAELDGLVGIVAPRTRI